MATLLAVLPLFAMIAFGFCAARIKLVSEAASTGIVNYIYFFALPPMLIAMLSGAEPDKLLSGSRFLVAMFLTEVVIAGLAVFWAWRTYGRQAIGVAGFSILGFSACFSNGVFLSVPLAIAALGPEAAAPALLLVTLDIMLFVVVTFLLENSRIGGGGAALSALEAIAKNPIILATLAGLALAFLSLNLPAPLQAFVDFVGPAAAPTALFALGVTLAMHPVSAASAKPAGVIVVLKLFAQPALAALILFNIPGIDPLWRIVGVLFAAGPVGMNAYLFARRYEIGVAPVSTAIVVSTGLSVLTLSALLLYFGHTV
jgi:predicted permease